MSLRLYDFECQNASCGRIHEALEHDSVLARVCPFCQWHAKRIISVSGAFCANEDAEWVRSSAAALLDPDIARKSHDPIERRLAENPTRSNLSAYMRHKGLRIVENEKGGPPVYRKPEGPDRAAIRKQLVEKHVARRRIEV